MKLTDLGPGNGHVAQEGFNRNHAPCTDLLLQGCLEGPLKEPCSAHTQIWYMGSAGRHDLRLASRSQLHLCTELAEPPWATVAQRGGWHRPPLPQAPYGGMGGQAGTQSPLFSTPLSGTGSTAILPGASEGIIRVPSSQPGPAATESGRLLMLGGGGEIEQLNPTGPQRGPKPSPLTLPPLGAEEAGTHGSVSPSPMHSQSSGGGGGGGGSWEARTTASAAKETSILRTLSSSLSSLLRSPGTTPSHSPARQWP